jgi:hypothetical protein
VASISAELFAEVLVNSIVPGECFVKMLAGFDFQKERKSVFIFYKSIMNFPKLFLRKNVEKKGNAMRAGISIAYPQHVNI